MHSRLEYLAPRYFSPAWYGARYFVTVFPPNPLRTAAAGFEDRIAVVPAIVARAAAGIVPSVAVVGAETRIVGVADEDRTVVAEPEERVS